MNFGNNYKKTREIIPHEGEWELVFAFSAPVAQGTQNMDMYSLRHKGKQLMVVLAVPQGAKDLPRQIELALNGIEKMPSRKEELATLERIFYGPWEKHPLTSMHFIRLSSEEHREIIRIVHRYGAENHMAETELSRLKEEHSKLKRAYETQGQQLLRLQANDFAECIPPEELDKQVATFFTTLVQEASLFDDNSKAFLGNQNPCGGS